ncbi:BamA/TamA family outer membrane protein [Prevotella hominis]|uniref:translocation and assembly module lipoprotein TamL n=1 Tax=Segatella hominis TaxID=2518605 RepID=UPI001F44A8FB|nr:BamA/TamA family outer membrane protein [Segatella hominis]MCF2591231.1 BamA/TamA family outer membrane protein [Segatella hominis]
MKRYSYIPFSILLLTTACSTGKYVQEGEYILDKVAVVSDQSDYNAAPLSQYVRQKEKPKLFSLFRNPFSRKPVIYDTLQARLSCQDLMTAMQNEGYMNAGVSLYTETKGKKLKATYLLHPGQPFLIGKVNYDIQDEGIQQLLHLDQTDNQQIKPGMRFTVETLDNERKRIAGLLSDNGYFRFNKDFIHFTADTVMGRKDIALTLQLRKYKSNSNSPEVDHTRYLIRDVLFQSNDSDRIHLRKQVLLNATAIKAGRPYDASALQRTYNNFARLQAVKYTNIKFAEVPDTNLLDCHIQISTNKPSTISFQPEGTNTAGDLGAAASITYTNRNLFHGSEQLSIEFRGAYEAITGLEGYQDQNYTEFSVETKLVFPRFLAPFLSKSFRRRQTASSEWAVSWNFQNRPEFHRRVFSSAWRYRWSEPKHHLNYRFDLLDLNYVYMPWISSTFKRDYLDNAENRNAILRYNYEDIFIMKAGFTVSYTDGVDAVRANFESAGNLLNGVSKGFGFKTNSQGQHTLFNIAYAQYVKLDFDYTHLFQFDKRNALALHAGLGVAYPYGNSTVLPFEKRYFSGGANSVRGWSVRELGPGKFKGTDGRIDFINQTGDVKLDLNAEYRSSLFWKLQGALFIDAGNIWTLRNYAEQPGGQFKFTEFYKQIAASYGMGLRLNFDYFILRFDMGMKAINPAYESEKEHWSIFHPKLSRDFDFHFAVGLPF